MADAGTFEEFVTTRSSGLLRAATLLTRDHALAEDLVQTALTRAWSVWKRIDGDPEPYVHRVLANTYNTWWRRRWHAERPTETLPEIGEPGGQFSVEARDEIWQALNRLPRQQRAVLVLRYFEDFTEVQVAQTLGISLGAVKSHANRALAKLRLDPTLLADFPVPRPPVSTERLTAVRQRIRHRKHQRVMGVVAIVMAVVAGFAVAPHLLRNVFPPAKVHTPQHFGGYLVRDTVTAKLTELDQMTTTWIPSMLNYSVAQRCDTRDVQFVASVSLRLNGKDFGTFPCTAEPEPLETANQIYNEEMATLKVGEPVVLSVHLQVLHGQSIPPDATLTLAFAEKVPFDQLPLPERPKQLRPLDSPDPGAAAVLRPGGPSSAKVTLPVDKYLEIVVRSQTPGIVHLAVNDHALSACTFYEYDGSSGVELNPSEAEAQRLDMRAGEPVTVSVSAEYTTGDWYVALVPTAKTG